MIANCDKNSQQINFWLLTK